MDGTGGGLAKEGMEFRLATGHNSPDRHQTDGRAGRKRRLANEGWKAGSALDGGRVGKSTDMRTGEWIDGSYGLGGWASGWAGMPDSG